MRRRIIETLSARVELLSGMDIIFDPRYFAPGTPESLLTDYGSIADAAEGTIPDGTLVLMDDEAAAPSLSASGRTVLARGPFSRLEREMPELVAHLPVVDAHGLGERSEGGRRKTESGKQRKEDET